MRVRIAELRSEYGLTQGEVAERAGISRPYLAQLENGSRTLNAKRQKQIAGALGVDPSDLVDFSAPGKNDEELLVRAFRALTPTQQKAWIELSRVTLSLPPEDQKED